MHAHFFNLFLNWFHPFFNLIDVKRDSRDLYLEFLDRNECEFYKTRVYNLLPEITREFVVQHQIITHDSSKARPLIWQK